MVLIGCTPAGTATPPPVSPASIAEFLQIVESKDYHQMSRQGQEVFKPGLTIPDHAGRFKEFPSSEFGPNRVRYVFYSFKGEASAGEVYLILEQDSGKVVEFNYFEALFE